MRTPAERTSEAVLLATEHWKSRDKTSDATSSGPRYTIAVSRETGARGTLVAREVGRRLGWAVYDQELLQLIAQEMGLRENLLQSVDEHHVSWLREVAAGFASALVVSESAYVQQLIDTVLSLGSHGRCIIVGRGSLFILPPERTLRVRMIAPFEARIAMASEDFHLSRHEAEEKVRKLDRERRGFVKEYFAKDQLDPTHYDLVLNAARFSVAECAEIIGAALHKMQVRGSARPTLVAGP